MEKANEDLFSIEQINEEILKIKLEIIEKENLINELLSIFNDETEDFKNS